jgi:hypothetical protein
MSGKPVRAPADPPLPSGDRLPPDVGARVRQLLAELLLADLHDRPVPLPDPECVNDDEAAR